MKGPYHLVEGDCAGPYSEKYFETFAELMAYHEANPTPKGSARFASNLERCDYDTNGLTEEEREVAP